MKTVTLFWLLICSLYASGSNSAQVDGTTLLHNYNHRFAVSRQHTRKLEKLAKIKEQEARAIAEKICKAPISSLRLKHKGQTLYYKAQSPKCSVEINALDGTILSQGTGK